MSEENVEEANIRPIVEASAGRKYSTYLVSNWQEQSVPKPQSPPKSAVISPDRSKTNSPLVFTNNGNSSHNDHSSRNSNNSHNHSKFNSTSDRPPSLHEPLDIYDRIIAAPPRVIAPKVLTAAHRKSVIMIQNYQFEKQQHEQEEAESLRLQQEAYEQINEINTLHSQYNQQHHNEHSNYNDPHHNPHNRDHEQHEDLSHLRYLSAPQNHSSGEFDDNEQHHDNNNSHNAHSEHRKSQHKSGHHESSSSSSHHHKVPHAPPHGAANKSGGRGGASNNHSSTSSPTPVYSGVSVGDLVEAYDGPTRSFQPRVVQTIHSDGTFDATDEFGNLHLNIDDSELKPLSLSISNREGGKGGANGVFNASSTVQRGVERSAKQQQHIHASVESTTHGAHVPQNVGNKYKIGTRVEVSTLVAVAHGVIDEQWLSGVVSQALGGSKGVAVQYMVAVDSEDSDRLVSASQLRPVRRQLENSVDYSEETGEKVHSMIHGSPVPHGYQPHGKPNTATDKGRQWQKGQQSLPPQQTHASQHGHHSSGHSGGGRGGTHHTNTHEVIHSTLHHHSGASSPTPFPHAPLSSQSSHAMASPTRHNPGKRFEEAAPVSSSGVDPRVAAAFGVPQTPKQVIPGPVISAGLARTPVPAAPVTHSNNTHSNVSHNTAPSDTAGHGQYAPVMRTPVQAAAPPLTQPQNEVEVEVVANPAVNPYYQTALEDQLPVIENKNMGARQDSEYSLSEFNQGSVVVVDTVTNITTTLPSLTNTASHTNLASTTTNTSNPLLNTLESHLFQDVGIKDSEKCHSVAVSLVAQGCTSWEDFLDLGSLFTTGNAKDDLDGLRRFLQDAEIPLFIAAKLAAFIKK
eukprot:gene25628-32104_t